MAKQSSETTLSFCPTPSCCIKENADADGLRPVTTSMTTMDVVISPIDKHNVQRLQELNLQLFPVRYNLAFYKEVVGAPPGYVQLVCVGDNAVGAICCRREPMEEGPEGLERTYIMTFGVMESFRRARIGSRLLESVIAQSIQDGVVQVYLHVQTSNIAALQFYRLHGFEATEILRNYYKHINPPDCYVLRRHLTP